MNLLQFLLANGIKGDSLNDAANDVVEWCNNHEVFRYLTSILIKMAGLNLLLIFPKNAHTKNN